MLHYTIIPQCFHNFINLVILHYYAIFDMFITCCILQYLNGLHHVITQLYGSHTSTPYSLALQFSARRKKFSNIFCFKIFQYYKLCNMLLVLFKNSLMKTSIVFIDVHVYLSTQFLMVSQQMSMNHSFYITHGMNSGDVVIIIINITCIGLYVSVQVHVMQCDLITNAMNMLVMYNKDIYYSHACSQSRSIQQNLTLHYYVCLSVLMFCPT